MAVAPRNSGFDFEFESPFGEFVESQHITGKRPDWLRHASSTPTLVPTFEPTGGPQGGVANDLRFDLGATSSVQRAAYVDVKLGNVRGQSRFSVSTKFQANAVRTKVAALARWNPARLESADACYAAELSYDVDRRVSDGACSTGSNTKVDSASAIFSSVDVGRTIVLEGAGAGGADYVGKVVSIDSAARVTVSPVVSTTVAGKSLKVAAIFCSLRRGPDEAGEVFFRKRLSPVLGFVSGGWMEVGMAFEVDSVGSLKIRTLVRPNTERSVSTAYATYGIDSDDWYALEGVVVARHLARQTGQVGFQIVARHDTADPAAVRIGGFRAIADLSTPTILPDDVVL